MKPSGAVFDGAMRQQCRVMPCGEEAVKRMVCLHHYLHKMPAIVRLCVVLCRNGRTVGAVVFADGPRQTSVRYGGMTWELARLWVEDAMPTNTESFLIGKAVRLVASMHPEVRFLVSYADPSRGHDGRIYRAANWRPDGRTDQERKTPRFDYRGTKTGIVYSRRWPVPTGVEIERVARISKWRYVYELGAHGVERERVLRNARQRKGER